MTKAARVSKIFCKMPFYLCRFECQYQYNKMLMKQIQRMRAEIRMLRNGNELPESFEIMKNMKTVGDWRKQIKDLNIEKWSLRSMTYLYILYLSVNLSVI